MLFLLHDVFRTHLARASDFAEVQLLTVELVAGEPVVATGVAVGAVFAEGQRDRVTAYDRVVTDPFGDIGDFVLQGQGFNRAARYGQEGQAGKQGFSHGFALWQAGHR